MTPTREQVIDAWNAQADQYNQWDELDIGEKIDFSIKFSFAAGQQAEREACKQACIEVRADGGGVVKQHEDNHADGFTDGCNECLFAVEERNNISVSGRNNEHHN